MPNETDATSERNDRLKATMRQTETPLSSAPQIVRSSRRIPNNEITPTTTNGHPYGDRR